MRKVVIIFFCLLACISLHAQEVQDVTFKRVGNTIEICYRLQHLPPRQYTWIEIYYSLDDGKNWQGPLKRIAGEELNTGAKNGLSGTCSVSWKKSMAFWLLKYEPLLKKRRSVERTSCCTVYRKQLLWGLCLPGFVVGDGSCV